MNILCVAPGIGRSSTGAGSIALNTALQQHRLGHRSVIWCLDPCHEAAEAAQQVGMPGENVRIFPEMGPAAFGFCPEMERAVSADETRSFEVLHQHGLWLAISRVAIRWRVKLGRPTVLSPHGYLNPPALAHSRLKKKLAMLLYEARNLTLASCLHATSELEEDGLRALGLRRPVAVIPNGISEDWLSIKGDGDRFRAEYSIPSDRRIVLFLGRVHPIKGLPLFLEAMGALKPRPRDWLLVVAGMDLWGHRRELEAAAEKHGLLDSITFVGPVYDQMKRDAYEAAELFVLPSLSENFGLVAAEALAAGVPVMASTGTPWRELQTRGCGWWVERTLDSFAETLADAFGQPQHALEAMGRRGRDLIVQSYTWPTIGRMSVSLYEWLLGSGKRPDFVHD